MAGDPPAPRPAGLDERRGGVYFLTDYGRSDELVGVVHAVLLRLAPGAPVVDLTHDIPPFSVASGARALARAAPHLGPGVVLGVVDPGVGSTRRPVALDVAAAAGPRFWVGPDNGLLLAGAVAVGGPIAAVELARADGADGAAGPVTFDGRDLFAPAAAALWAGAALRDLGAAIDPGTLADVSEPRGDVAPIGGGGMAAVAEILWVDRFGNVQLSLFGHQVPVGSSEVRLEAGRGDRSTPQRVPEIGRGLQAPRPARRVRTFADLDPGELGVLEDANGHLAVVLREAAASRALEVGVGDVLRLTWRVPAF